MGAVVHSIVPQPFAWMLFVCGSYCGGIRYGNSLRIGAGKHQKHLSERAESVFMAAKSVTVVRKGRTHSVWAMQGTFSHELLGGFIGLHHRRWQARGLSVIIALAFDVSLFSLFLSYFSAIAQSR